MTTTRVVIRRPQRMRRCGFCNSGNHQNCAVGTKDAQNRITLCLCTQGGCKEGRRKCITCGNRETTEVNPETWECLDVEACRATVQARSDSNPLVTLIRRSKENAAMAQVEANKEKADKEKAVKPKTYCLVTGEETKGGKFKPGMDARYASELVQAVTAGHQTEESALKKAKDDGVSEALQNKIAKGIRLAKAKADKAAKAKAEKEKAKADKAASNGSADSNGSAESSAETEPEAETEAETDVADGSTQEPVAANA